MSYSSGIVKALQDPYPWWAIKKEGTVVIKEADWPATIGFKWGTFIEGTSTVVKDSNHYFGGSGCVKMLTDNVVSHNAELKINLMYPLGGGRYAFEQKFATGDPAPVSATTRYHMGIEPRENAADGFWQGRVRYSNNTDNWQYESGIDTYTNFAPDLVIEQPVLDTAVAGPGDKWGWGRLVVDTIKKQYVSFEAAGKGKIEFRDMTGIPLVSRGAATAWNLLVFVLIISGSNNVEALRSTDWMITKV